MQRWIVLAGVAIILAMAGAVVGYYKLKQGRPAPIWVPLVFSENVSEERKNELVANLRKELSKSEIMEQVAADTGAAGHLDVKTNGEAAQIIQSRLFVDIGEADTPLGTKVPALRVGYQGTRGDIKFTKNLAERTIKDVYRILGIPEPKPGLPGQ